MSSKLSDLLANFSWYHTDEAWQRFGSPAEFAANECMWALAFECECAVYFVDYGPDDLAAELAGPPSLPADGWAPNAIWPTSWPLRSDGFVAHRSTLNPEI